MEKEFTPLDEIEKTYFPRNHEKKYLQRLAKEGEIEILARYLVDNNIDMYDKELDLRLTKNMSTENIGSLFAKLSIEEMRVNLSNLTI